jgi:hypothetical protein
LAVAEREQATAHRIVTSYPKRLEEPPISRLHAACLVNHKERLFEGVNNPLRLDMFAAQQPVQVFQIHSPLASTPAPEA